MVIKVPLEKSNATFPVLPVVRIVLGFIFLPTVVGPSCTLNSSSMFKELTSPSIEATITLGDTFLASAKEEHNNATHSQNPNRRKADAKHPAK